MRKIFAGLTAATFVVALGAPAFAKTETVKGELVEMSCYTADNTKVGPKHKECGESCAKKGGPIGVLTADGKVYTIAGGLAANSNAKLLGHISETVEITGDVTTKDGKMMIAADALKGSKS
jgi:predicted lipoprotein with Yx(FWY)xxD motif